MSEPPLNRCGDETWDEVKRRVERGSNERLSLRVSESLAEALEHEAGPDGPEHIVNVTQAATDLIAAGLVRKAKRREQSDDS